MKTCSIEGCNDEVIARGWCNKHYSRWKRHGDPTKTIKFKDHDGTCTLDECQEDHYCKGFCRLHYQRQKRHGSPFWEPEVLEPGESSKNFLLRDYKRKAKDRGINWNLTDEQCEELFQGNCQYCGAGPSHVIDRNDFNGSYTYNGIDRIDNDKGYTPDNVVSCCGICNKMKMDLDLDLFLNRCKTISQHQEVIS